MKTERERILRRWRKKDAWELWQGVALKLGIDPDKVKRNLDGSFNESVEFDRLLQEAQAAVSRGELPDFPYVKSSRRP